MLLFIQNFAKIRNMPSFRRSDHHIRHPSSLNKIWRILLWRTQNPTVTRYLWFWGHSPYYGSLHIQWQSICTQYNFTILKGALRLEAKVWEPMVLKGNQVYEKRASKQPQETKFNLIIVFELKLTNMRHLRPYWPQTASESQIGFWVRQGKILQILIRQTWRFVWSSDL